jgi:molybdopterin synthase sulfur carrier subunit
MDRLRGFTLAAMANLRLFANLREIAGTSRIDIPAQTVGDVIVAANEKFGAEFERGVETAHVWVNGEEAGLSDSVSERDEVVLLPPVSGGAQPATMVVADLLGFVPLAVLALVVLANLQNQAIWAAALVAIAAFWALDLSTSFATRTKTFAPLAVVTSSAAGALTAHILGGAGYSLSVALAVAIVLSWAVVFSDYRQIDVFSPTLVAALLTGLGTASLVLARASFTPDEKAVDVFLVAVVVGALLSSLVTRLPPMPFVDPFSTSAVGALLAAIGAAVVWNLDVVGYLLVGLGVAVAMLAGSGLSSMLRTESVTLTQRPPGVLASLDSAFLAAVVYYPLIKVIL